ncbi:MAG: hypothetical protein IRZ18_09435 [Clostridia bacterium]|nr:hypothetical protein [Clostridia bacterium]
MTKRARRVTGWGAIALAAALWATACSHDGTVAGSDVANAPSETSEAPSTSESDAGALEALLPASASYHGPYDFTSTWLVSRGDDNVLKVKETVGDFDTTYTLVVEDGCLKQTSIYTMKGVEEPREAIWLCVPARSFANEYRTEDSTVKETATETWLDDPKYGRVLEVRVEGQNGDHKYVRVDDWASGLGLVHRVVKDDQGKILEEREIIFAGS